MTKKKQPSRLKKTGRKPIPLKKRRWYTLDEIRARCGAEDDEECWDCYSGMHGQVPKTEHNRRYPVLVQGGVCKVLVRRLAWFLLHGEDPPEGTLLVMTKCDNHRCQNPHHATPMFEKQKCQRAGNKGRLSSPLKNKKIALAKRAQVGKLANGIETAREIRANTTPSKDEPWKAYGISYTMWKRIRSNKAWIDYDNLGVFERMAA